MSCSSRYSNTFLALAFKISRLCLKRKNQCQGSRSSATFQRILHKNRALSTGMYGDLWVMLGFFNCVICASLSVEKSSSYNTSLDVCFHLHILAAIVSS